MTNHSSSKSSLTAEELGELTKIANTQTATGAARALGVHRAVVLQALAQQPIRRGSVLLLREALAAHRHPGGPPEAA